MSQGVITSLQPVASSYFLMPSPFLNNIAQKERGLEMELKEKIIGFRKSAGSKIINWDQQLSYILQTVLPNFELEKISKYLHFLTVIAGEKFSNEDFQSMIKNYVP